jgi:hypothetical protein
MFASSISLIKTYYTVYSTEQTLFVFRKFLRGVSCDSDVDDYESDYDYESHILKVRTTLILLVDSHVKFFSLKNCQKMSRNILKSHNCNTFLEFLLGVFKYPPFLEFFSCESCFFFCFRAAGTFSRARPKKKTTRQIISCARIGFAAFCGCCASLRGGSFSEYGGNGCPLPPPTQP